MTFRDLLTWYIEGKYVPSKELKYEIKKAHNTVYKPLLAEFFRGF
jgi:hypothetical protein